ncbi:MAG: hypothetical protein ACRDZR_13355 [Acidimicrobiales bacterium]
MLQVDKPRPVEATPAATVPAWRPPDWHRSLQLALAFVWLLDGVLQLQGFMFTSGSNGFSGMLAGMATGNPGAIASSITWNAHVVGHHAIATNTAFALIQVAIGLGIAWRPAVKPALALSIAWSLGVWWFGEGLGGVLHGTGSPVAGGPGAVLFYALLAVLLWPAAGRRAAPFAAAGAVGARAARAVWSVTWVLLALLCLLGAGRAPKGIHDVVAGLGTGEPGWLGALDRHVASGIGDHGLLVAVLLAACFLVFAVAVHLPETWVRPVLAFAVVVSLAIWVFGQNFGMMLAGGATDPNSGPLLVLLVLAYWPLRPATAVTPTAAAHTPTTLEVA